MSSDQDLIKRLEKIEQRNRRVELDKAWESSVARRLLIVLFTYISIGAYMWAIGVDRPLLNAVIPSLGFTLSTLTLPYFKQVWIKKHEKNSSSFRSYSSELITSSIVLKSCAARLTV